MKKLMVIALMLVLTGCATMRGDNYTTFNKVSINGREVYVGMSQQSLENLVGAPDSSEAHTSSNILNPSYSGNVQYATSYTRSYGAYTVMLSDGLVVSIWTTKAPAN